MKREKMLTERRCGLKYWDKAVEKVGKQNIIDKAIEIHIEMPNTWGPGWRNFDWALGNACREIVSPDRDVQMSWNVNDVLSDEEMKLVAGRCGFVDQYQPCWERE